MIPKWMPFGATFWAVLTGIAFVLAGAAIVSGVLDVLAARLLGLMLLVFSALALAPLIFSSPHDHASWGANAYNLTAIGAAWIVAEWLDGIGKFIHHGRSATSVKPAPRIQSVDALRGAIMMLMAIDHIRDCVARSAQQFLPTDLTRTTPVCIFLPVGSRTFARLFSCSQPAWAHISG